MRTLSRGWLVWVLLAALISLLALGYRLERRGPAEMSLTELRNAVLAAQVKAVKVSGDESSALVTLKDGSERRVRKEQGAETLYQQLGLSAPQLAGIEYSVGKDTGLNDVVPLLGALLPFALMMGFLIFMVRQAQAGNSQALSFGRSRARLMAANTPTVTFGDVAGVDEAKQELAEVVEFLREPDKFMALGAKIPRGVLMVGPPGCGKTLMAKAVAGEAGVPFFSISGSEFVEMFVGVGASRVRDLFDQAKKHAPCIIFIDEIDAVGRQRGTGLGGSHDEREQTLNQILVEMDGFDTSTNVIVLAATNRPDILDPALLRPGRFDRRVVIDRPDMNGRLAILRIHGQGKPLAEDVDLEVIARQTPGFSGADLENLINEAAILAARRNGRAIRMADLREAADKVRYGPQRRGRAISRHELEITAYHEAGHALVTHLIPECDPVERISIIPRGLASGMTTYLPEDDRYLRSRVRFKADLAAALGGRAAELVVFGDASTGASQDLEFVTRTARDMVTRFGMSDALGPLTFGERQELVFLGRDIAEQRNYSEKTAQAIDSEVRALIAEADERARGLVSAHVDSLHQIAQRLLDVETIERAEFLSLMAEPISPTSIAAEDGQPAVPVPK